MSLKNFRFLEGMTFTFEGYLSHSEDIFTFIQRESSTSSEVYTLNSALPLLIFGADYVSPLIKGLNSQIRVSFTFGGTLILI